MPKRIRWTYTTARAAAHGCDLTVSATTGAGDTWAWFVVAGGQHVANGGALSMESAQEQAEAAARRHAEGIEEQSRQMTLF
ncbi:hypothetical protein [Azospirillum soli]|uniref:hypothetical protein n=1 Tax=Azospirillum soli TaxID=1304799 RepID=UPI001AE4D5CE|nr:hypothetical protein [Azospirillum soli]MBP2315498.1 hypothetical protein [Azospirillum soli]